LYECSLAPTGRLRIAGQVHRKLKKIQLGNQAGDAKSLLCISLEIGRKFGFRRFVMVTALLSSAAKSRV
jgi:hypothetical protein